MSADPTSSWEVPLIMDLQSDPQEALAQLSAAVSVAFSLDFSAQAWLAIEIYLADDGMGSYAEREAQAALLAWLRAERRYGLEKDKEADANG